MAEQPSVFSLPMRDWNSFGDVDKNRAYEFLAYLWGIETSPVAGLFRIKILFLAYLWGIETASLKT